MTNKSFRVILAVILFSFSIWLLYPREVVFAPEMEITILSNNKQIVAKANAKRTYRTYLDEEGIVDNFTNADENGKVKFESVKGRVPLIAQWIKFVTTLLSPHDYPSSGGRILARDSQNHFLWKDVGYKNEDCCPTEIVIEMQKSEMYDSNLGINK